MRVLDDKTGRTLESAKERFVCFLADECDELGDGLMLAEEERSFLWQALSTAGERQWNNFAQEFHPASDQRAGQELRGAVDLRNLPCGLFGWPEVAALGFVVEMVDGAEMRKHLSVKWNAVVKGSTELLALCDPPFELTDENSDCLREWSRRNDTEDANVTWTTDSNAKACLRFQPKSESGVGLAFGWSTNSIKDFPPIQRHTNVCSSGLIANRHRNRVTWSGLREICR